MSPFSRPSGIGTLAHSCQDPSSHIDDEYAKVGTYDPKIVITTSRSPSSRLLQFSKVSQIARDRHLISDHGRSCD